MGSPPTGFSYAVQHQGEVVVIRHHGRIATLRGAVAARFLTEVKHGNAQQLMARTSGNYRRGTERDGRDPLGQTGQ
jgi:hypothetical protein